MPSLAAASSARERLPATHRASAFEPQLMLRVLGSLGLIGILTSTFLLAAGASHGPSDYVRLQKAGWPSWVAGPFQGLGLHLRLDHESFQALTLVMLGAYLLVLVGARSLPALAIGTTVAIAYLLLMLGPPLLSQDVFGYVSFGRMGALHGLDPYTHVAAEAPSDPTLPFIGWPFQHTPYGPLFTLLSYAVVQLGFAGALWAFKAIAVITSAGAVALVAIAARSSNRSGRFAAAFLGLNPVMLEFAVGGSHNDTITLLLVAGALAIASGAAARLKAAAWPLAVAVGFKISAGVLLPFLVLSPEPWIERAKVLASAVGGLIVVGAIGAIGFGTNMVGFLVPIGEEQQQLAVHSIPAETARLLGLGVAPTWWRYLFDAGFLFVLALCMWRTAKGFDWRAAAGWSTVALVVSTAWLLPWYAVWALPLAAVSTDKKLRVVVLLFCLYALMIRLPLAEGLLGSGT